jgi:hypothetical protein
MPKICYLQPRDLVRHSRHHTAYASDKAIYAPTEKPQLVSITFINGVARDIPEDIYRRFKDLGIADTKRPSFDDEVESLVPPDQD